MRKEKETYEQWLIYTSEFILVVKVWVLKGSLEVVKIGWSGKLF